MAQLKVSTSSVKGNLGLPGLRNLEELIGEMVVKSLGAGRRNKLF
jgi:hypothetical protein